MRHPARARHGLNLIGVAERLQSIPDPLAPSENDGNDHDMQVIDKAGGQEFTDGPHSATDADVAAASEFPRSRNRFVGRGVDEMKGCAAGHLNRRTRVVRQHDHRGMKRRIVSPPALPLVVGPGALKRAKFPPPHDFDADALAPCGRESVINPGGAGLALHRLEGARREEPFMQAVTRVAEGRIGALAGTGAEAIERHREVVHPNALHALPPFIRTEVWYAVVSRISTPCGRPAPYRTVSGLGTGPAPGVGGTVAGELGPQCPRGPAQTALQWWRDSSVHVVLGDAACQA